MTTMPRILVCTPHDIYFIAECEVQINNFRKFGYSNLLTILVFEEEKDTKDQFRDYWNQMQQKYNEVTILFYSNPGLNQLLKIYPQVCRPWMLSEYYKQYPELKWETVLYMDSDVLFTRMLDLSVFSNDQVCYLSKTDYISADYFENKKKDVMFHKKAEYETRDILGYCCHIVGVDKQLVIDNVAVTGGCQYILRGIDSDFWVDVMNHCIELRMYCMDINRQFFLTEEKGLQSWAIADMNGLLWNLWKRGIKTECPVEMDFSWSSSPVSKYQECAIFHNAGVTGKYIEVDGKTHKMFNKADSRFRTGALTFFDITDWGDISTDYCSYHYIEAIQEVKDPVCVTKKVIY